MSQPVLFVEIVAAVAESSRTELGHDVLDVASVSALDVVEEVVAVADVAGALPQVFFAAI